MGCPWSWNWQALLMHAHLKNNHAMCIFQQVMSTTSTLNRYISIPAMCWFQQTMSTKHSTFITTPSIIHDQDFVFKKTVFSNNAIFSKLMSESKDFFLLIQAPNISKHIPRNGGATIKASRKTAHDKIILLWGKKAIFSQKMAAPSKKSDSPKYVYWYQCFSVWKMVGAKSMVLSRPPGRPNAFAIP